MNIVDLLVTIIVVTILVTIVLAVMTYVAYKLRLARRPAVSDAAPGARYFDAHDPPEVPDWDIEAEQAREEPAPAPARDAPSETPVEPVVVDSLDRVS